MPAIDYFFFGAFFLAGFFLPPPAVPPPGSVSGMSLSSCAFRGCACREQLRELFHAGLDVRSLRVSTVVIVAPASLERRSTGLSAGGVIVCG